MRTMRRTIYLISSFLLLGSSAFAQGPDNEKSHRKEPELKPQVAEPHPSTLHRFPHQSAGSSQRAACHGDTILYEDFGATPAGTGDSIVGNNSLNVDWDTSGTGPAWRHCDSDCQDGGLYPIGPMESPTATNGYVVAEMFATFQGATSPPEVHLEMDSAIDLTGYEQPMISFETLFRHCCARGHNVFLEVLTDTGWFRFNPARYFGINYGTPNSTKFTYSLEKAVQNNMDSVKIRFTWPPTDDNGTYSTAYSWFIDDIVIREAHRNDVSLTLADPVVPKNSDWYNNSNEPFYTGDFGLGGVYPGKNYTMVPRCEMDPLRMGGQLMNQGSNSLSNAQLETVVQDTTTMSIKLRDSVQVAVDSQSAYNGELPGYDPPFADTLWSPSNFQTQDKGVYNVIQNAGIGDTADCHTDNNLGVPEQAFSRVEVTERTFAIDEYNLYGSYFTPFAAVSFDPNNSGEYEKFTVYNAFEFSWLNSFKDTVKQVCFHVNADCTEAGATVTAGISSFTGNVYGQSSLYTIKSSDLGSMVCLDVAFKPNGDEINGVAVPKNTDSLTTAFVQYNGSSNNFGISSSGYRRFWQYSSWFKRASDPNPFVTNYLPAVRVKMNQKAANCEPLLSVKENSADQNGFLVEQNRPNPFSGKSTVAYELSKPADKVTFKVRDVTGKIVHSKEIGQKGQGRHRIELNSSKFDAGVYYYSLKVDGVKETKKMMVTQ